MEETQEKQSDDDVTENIEEAKKETLANLASRLTSKLKEDPGPTPTLVAFNNNSFGDNPQERVRFTRGCKVSPDGLCVLTNSSDNKLRIFELPPDTKSECVQDVNVDPCLRMTEGEMIYDFCWFPQMNSSVPDTCCLASTAQYHPIHLYDAYDASIRATYRCFDHFDEMIAANCVAFNQHGDKLYAGLNKEIRIFDVAVPGRDCYTRKTWTKQDGGQGGKISCIATNPYLNDVYALGSYSKTLGIYLEPTGQLLCLLTGQKGGLTHIKFSGDGSKILAGGRKNGDILVWDLRNPGNLLCTLKREVTTNQRIYFDIHPNDPDLVISGGTDGTLAMWDLSQPLKDESSVLDPIWKDNTLHTDCVNGVSFKPEFHQGQDIKEITFASTSGQRHFYMNLSDDENEENDRKSSECKLKIWKISID